MPISQDPMQGIKPCFKPLPPAAAVPAYPGMLQKFIRLLESVSCTMDEYDNDWMVVSPDGRRLRVPKTESGTRACSSGVMLLMSELRVTMGDGSVAFAIQEDTGRLWHRTVDNGRTMFHPIASIEAEFGIAAVEHMNGIDEFVRRCVEQVPAARLVLGVKFANKGFARTKVSASRTELRVVGPDDPRFNQIWALDLSDIAYCTARVERFRSMAQTVVDGDAATEMLARTIAAPVCQPYMHGIAFLTGPGGNGKGLTIEATAALYGRLGAPFSLAALLGVGRSSSTTNDQASIGLLTGLLAYDSDAVNPGQGLVENLKKAAAGEELSMRLLQQNVATNRATAFMIAATNRGSTLPSTPEWRRRIWITPFRSDTGEETVLRWADYLGDGTTPDDGIIDALMAGAASFAFGRPDPMTVSCLTEGLTLYGQTVRGLLMSCAPLEEHGLPDKPRVPVSHQELRDLRVGEKERREQLALMGLATASMRDVHGDGQTRQVIYIKDLKRFEPFADEWRRQNAANQAEQAEEDKSKQELIQKAQGLLLDAQPLAEMEAAQQISLLRTIAGLDGRILVPSASQWDGKGIKGSWNNDESGIPHPLHDYDLTNAPDRYGFSVSEDLLILDCDSSKQVGEEHGLDSLMRIPGVSLDDLDTLVMRSPHGLHLVYRMPDRWVGHVKASTGVHGTRIDLRPGCKSYVIGPGSHWTDGQGEHAYPGIVRLPSPKLIPCADEASQKERRLPVLPDAIARWIMSDRKCFDAPMASLPSRHHTTSIVRRDDEHVNLQPMGTGQTHDSLCSMTMQAAGRAKNRGWSPERLDEEMNRIRDAVPASHDPADTERCIESAIRKAGLE